MTKARGVFAAGLVLPLTEGVDVKLESTSELRLRTEQQAYRVAELPVTNCERVLCTLAHVKLCPFMKLRTQAYIHKQASAHVAWAIRSLAAKRVQ